MELPDLIDIQLSSYESFLQKNKLDNHETLAEQGLEEAFRSSFPIESPNGDMSLKYDFYELDEQNIKFNEYQCKQKGLTYSVPLKARVKLIFKNSGEIRQKDIYMGDIPLMTERGTFIINGAERVVVSQIHRSPGVIFSHEKDSYSSRIIPYRGSWLEFEIDQKKELIYAKIDRKKRILGTIFLRALGYSSREEIIRAFYETTTITLEDSKELREELIGKVLAKAVFVKDEDKDKKLLPAGSKLHPHDIDELLSFKEVKEIEVIDFKAEDSLDSQMIINCFEREEIRFTKEGSENDEPTRDDALAAVYSVLLPGEPITAEAAEKDLESMFFKSTRYDLGRVGRYKLNSKFNYKEPVEEHTLVKQDIIATMKFFIKVYIDDMFIF